MKWRYALGCLALALAGCSGGVPAATITVSAASSLTGAFTELGRAFEATHPDTSVRFNFGGSGSLAEQIVQGAPADVFASASTATMQTVLDAGRASAAVIFASNTLTIVTPPDNPAYITSVADLHRPLSKVNIALVVCDDNVPCGAATETLFTQQGWLPGEVHVASREPDVKSVLAKVVSGEADAGIVYVTDARAAGASVHVVPIPGDQNVSTTYPIAVLSGSVDPAAQQFVEFVVSPDGQAVLEKHGFGAA